MKFLIISSFLLSIFIVNGLQVNRKQNFCQIDRCLTCLGRYCTTTCRGLNCRDCPIGDCCNGTNCNICRGIACCNDLECNDCVRNCLETCQNQTTCHYGCFKKCVPEEEFAKGQLIVHQVNNYLPVNVTTIINVTNTITNENHIDNPIVVNSTNVFNHTVNEAELKNTTIIDDNSSDIDDRNGFVNDEVNDSGRKTDCCTVIHPRICRHYHVQKYCFIGKHRECSNLCSSKFVHIIETTSSQNNNNNNNCIFIGVKPYFFCGNFKTENCDGCYECPAQANCQQSSGCSETCQHSLIRDNLYNKLFIDNRSNQIPYQ